ncbi:MAG TPA: PDZ domain-containing protein [Gemmataceae bacterium]|jgi:S1-C subfamily serine protease|nr:PDZ domain-containing protein [Gemmataceae bacterium]
MNALKGTLLALFAGFLFSLAATAQAQDEKKDKEKPKDAATLNDEEQEVTTTSGTKQETKKIDLKYYLQVSGYFDKQGYNIEKITEGSPVTQLSDDNGNNAIMLEVGDIIVEVDGKKVTTPQEYAKALNNVADPEKIKLKVKDKNTGNDIDLYVSARKR